jgi:hypothetical protein
MALKATEMHEDAAPDSRKPVAPAILSPVFLSNPNRVFRGATRATLILRGRPAPRAVRHGDMRIVTPKSVGLQAYDDRRWAQYMETGNPHVGYDILDPEPAVGWRISLIVLEYDWPTAADDSRRAGRPDWAYALETGYARR